VISKRCVMETLWSDPADLLRPRLFTKFARGKKSAMLSKISFSAVLPNSERMHSEMISRMQRDLLGLDSRHGQ
jgi:hypothetical protein